jgi:MscS family membrane protein
MPNKQMVDSIMDNLSLRTQRRAFVQLEIDSDTGAEKIDQLVAAIERLLQERKDRVENFTVYLSDINKNAFFIPVEFFTAPVPIGEFNGLRQEVNREIINAMRSLGIRLASKDPVTAATI